jgi:hypothetical protein
MVDEEFGDGGDEAVVQELLFYVLLWVSCGDGRRIKWRRR